MLIFRQLFDPQSSTYTYLLGDGRAKEAVLIDPVFELAPRDAALLLELGLKLVVTLETHIHADHVTGAWMMKRKFGSQIALSADSGAEGADRYLAHGDRIAFGSRHLVVRATPGHTRSCVTYVLDDESMAFTGDCMLIRGSGRTDFQQGDPHALYRSVHSQILTLPQACLLYPAHDYRGLTVTSVAEERNFNPRLGGEISEDDFTGYMSNLGLPHPKKMDIAVPANMQCGRPGSEEIADEQAWAPLTYTFAGVWEIAPQSLRGSGGAGGSHRRARAGRIRRSAGTHPRREADSAGTVGAASRRASPRSAAGHRLPFGRALGAGDGRAAARRISAGRQPQRRHAALARRRPRGRDGWNVDHAKAHPIDVHAAIK